jgi:hypothetical protein
MLSKARAIGLGLLVLLVAGGIASATASAGPGPFWYHREGPGENGLKIQAASPEGFFGTGGPQELRTSVGEAEVVLTSPGVKITGFIWNNNLQGQIKLRLKYAPITIVKPKLPGCQAEVFSQPAAHNVVYAEGHLAWKWNGEKKQLEEQKQKEQLPDIIFVPPGTQIQQGAEKQPEGIFAEIRFLPMSLCGILGGITLKIKGDTVGNLVQPQQTEQWSNTLAVALLEGKQKQHFWNGEKFVGIETGLLISENATSLIGQENILETLRQEVAIFEN